MRFLYAACLIASPIFLLSYAGMVAVFMATHPTWLGVTVVTAHVLQAVAFGFLLDSRSARRQTR